MKCTIPEISWHNRDPVLSIDIQPTKNGQAVPYRLATGGTDSHVVIWYVTVKECGLASVEVAADLQRHQRAVNSVRFSPSGQFLASGDDESVIIVWKLKTEHDISDLSNNDGDVSKEQWVSVKTLRGHLEDVYDISWSLDSTHLISGSIDNTAIIWDVHKGRNLGILSGHGGFIQGVTWDPKNKYVATLSSDRTCRVYNVSSKKLTAKIGKAILPVPPGSELNGKVMRLFHDDTLKSFFRRLSFSPDGELLVTPSGVIEIPNNEKHINATYMFSRHDFSKPVVYLPSPHEYTVAVRFCPLLFKLREGSPLFVLPYRMVFAIATKSNVILYDTQQLEPIALISKIHYTRLTDLSWSSDGQVLIASSTDGYCSIITFCEDELGEVYELPSVNTDSENGVQNSENKQSDCTEATGNDKQNSSTSDAISNSENEVEKEKLANATINKSSVKEVDVGNMKVESEVTKKTTIPVADKKSPRRISLITLSSPRKRRITTPEMGLKKGSGNPITCDVKSKVSSELEEGKDEIKNCTSAMNAREEQDHEKMTTSKFEGTSLQNANIKDIVQPAPIEKSHDSNSNFKENKEKNEKDAIIHGSVEEPMEIEEIPVLGSSLLEGKGASSKDKVPGSVGSSKKPPCEPTSSTAGDEKKQSDNQKLNDKRSDVKNINENEDCSGVEEEDKKSISKDVTTDIENINIEHLNSEKNLTNNCSKSPMKISVASVCENTPSKLNDMTEVVESATPKRLPDEVPHQSEAPCNVTPVEKRTPRRVQFITISSPKSKKKLM